ncbi:MAG: hypothetical protein ACP5M7_10065 [Thermoproteota archaeon]
MKASTKKRRIRNKQLMVWIEPQLFIEMKKVAMDRFEGNVSMMVRQVMREFIQKYNSEKQAPANANS